MAAHAFEASQIGLDAMRVLGLNPNQALQHPGFYYYMGRAVHGAAQGTVPVGARGWGTSHHDCLCCVVHCRCGLAAELVDRFFERIAKTYRRESWEPLLHPLLSQWYKRAQQLGDVDLSVRLLAEMRLWSVGPLLSPSSQHALMCDPHQARMHLQMTSMRCRRTHWPCSRL